MPPEQIRSLDIDRRTDIYAAAVVLWEMLVGRPLFRAENEAATMHLVLGGEVLPPSKLVPGIFPALDAIVMRGLARSRDERFPTAKAMAEALQTIGFATAGEVGEWVRRLGAEDLEARARAVAEIESRTIVGLPVPPPPATDAVPTTIARPPQIVLPNSSSAKTKAFLPLALLAAVTLLGGAIAAGFWLGKSQGVEEPKAAAAAPTSAPSAAPPPPAPAAQVSAVVTASPVDSAPPAPSASAPAKKPERPRGGPCNPPYTVDADGIRTPKPECL
jgi:serine/threonine-protein kinase